MNKNKIIKSVKRQEEEKVGFSLKLPASLKDQLQKLAELESISMNALIVATLQSMIDDECGKQIVSAMNLLGDYEESLLIGMNQIQEYGIDEDNAKEYEKMSKNYKQIKLLQKED